jgi:hypothetical protein
MFYFLVSGYVPGTDIQITFSAILLLGLAIIGVVLLYAIVHRLAVRIHTFSENTELLEEIAL